MTQPPVPIIDRDTTHVLTQNFPGEYKSVMQDLYDRAIGHLNDEIMGSIAIHLYDTSVLFDIIDKHQLSNNTTAHPFTHVTPNGRGITTSPSADSKLTWVQYFALYALFELSMAIYYYRTAPYYYKDFQEGGSDPSLSDSIKAITGAAESLATADQLSKFSSSLDKIGHLVEEEVSKTLSRKNSLAAKKGHEERNRIKRKFARYFEAQEPGITKKEIAHVFVESLSEQDVIAIGRADPERNLLEFLRQYLKNIRSSQT